MQEERSTSKRYGISHKFLKADYWEQKDITPTDQQKGVPVPLAQKPLPTNPELIDLPPVQAIDLKKLIEKRRSHRKFSAMPLTLEQLSYLCWSTQGVQKVFKGGRLLRTVPSAGSRHSLETYLIINQVDKLPAGLYRYLGMEHKLLRIQAQPDVVQQCAIAGRARHACHFEI